MRRIRVDSNSLNVVRLLTSTCGRLHPCYKLVMEIPDVIDKLTKEALESYRLYHIFYFAPNFILNVLRADMARGLVTRAMSKRLQEDWARAAEEGPRILMNLKTHLLLKVASPLSLPSPFRCHLSSKKLRNPLMKKILGLQAPMELTSLYINGQN
ncbi:hypothetical protein HKD37_14G039889 [Glycine soja]